MFFIADIIEPQELNSVNPNELTQYLNKIITANPVKQSRFSKQAWLFPFQSKDKIFKVIQDRYEIVV